MSEIFEDKIRESFEKKGIADRNLARVPVSFPLQYLSISEEEFKSLSEVYKSGPTRERSEGGEAPQSQVGVAGTMTAVLIERMDRIEEKLDLLLLAAGMDADKSKNPAMEFAQARDLSGSGVQIMSRMAMANGWYLKLSFNLPGPQQYNVVTLGRIVRVGSQNESGYYESACQFESICEEDQDHIIAYVFRRQRELARNRGMGL